MYAGNILGPQVCSILRYTVCQVCVHDTTCSPALAVVNVVLNSIRSRVLGSAASDIPEGMSTNVYVAPSWRPGRLRVEAEDGIELTPLSSRPRGAEDV